MKKKIKLDGSSASDVKQEEDGSEEGVKDPPANEIDVNQGRLNKPRNKADTDRSSGSVSVSIDDEDSQTKKMGNSSSSSASRSSEGSITEKRDSASLTNEEERKKRKLDISSSSGSDSNAKQGDGSEEAASTSVPTSSVMDDNLSPTLTEDKPRNQDDKDFSSGSVPASTHDHDSQTKKTGSSSSPLTESASCSSKNERILVYQKTLTRDDVFYCRLMIPLESGIEFLPEPEKYDGRYDLIEISVIDRDKQMWEMEASFDELSSSYMFWSNWDKYVKKHKLEPEDVIFFYVDPTIEHCFFIEYEKRKRDRNSKETT